MAERFPLLTDEQIRATWREEWTKRHTVESFDRAVKSFARTIESVARAPLLAEIARLTAERDAALVDAERYRWLRANSYVEVNCDSPRNTGWEKHQLDAAIDAARKEPANG